MICCAAYTWYIDTWVPFHVLMKFNAFFSLVYRFTENVTPVVGNRQHIIRMSVSQTDTTFKLAEFKISMKDPKREAREIERVEREKEYF